MTTHRLRLLPLAPFALLLIILPYPGTVAARLLFLLMAFLVAAWQRSRMTEAPSPIPCKPALAVWIIVGLLSLPGAVDPSYTAGELKNELGYTMMAFFAFFTVARERDAAVVLLRALSGGLALMIAWASTTWAMNGFVWMESARHGGVGIVATYSVAVVPALIWLTLEDPAENWRRAGRWLVGGALFLAAITAQRAIWPALLAELVVAALLLSRAGLLNLTKGNVIKYALALSAIAVIGLMLGMTQRDAGQLADDTRLKFWPDVVAKIIDHPWQGAGFGIHAMRKAYPEMIPAYNTQLWHGHNMFLNYGLSMGLPGIAALIGLLAAWGRFFWQAYRNTPATRIVGIAGLTLLVGIITRNQFNDFFVRDMSLLFWSLTGLFAGLVGNAHVADTRTSDDETREKRN